MFQSNYTTILLFICLVFSLYLSQQCLASFVETTTVATKNFDFKAPPPYNECGSADIRNNCSNFIKIQNCTVITGFLVISHNFRSYDECNLKNTELVNLREITDFLLITQLPNITSIKNMFPSLTVIRGRRLLRNYALIITSLNMLEKVEFKSLIALQRGHALIDRCPKLCFTEKINWTSLAPRRGKNNIFLHEKAQCPNKSECSGCKRDSCWSNDVCQKFEGDSVISLTQDTSECHEQCLGGCYNNTAQGCVVCKGYMDHGTCVKECPNDKYTSSHYFRCYTRDECIHKKKYLIFKNTCIESCPVGYKQNSVTFECEPCNDTEECLTICDGIPGLEIMFIPDIEHAARIKNCQILNASVVIDIYEDFDPEELKELLKNIKEIKGYLKINRSPYLISLDFLQNLEKIHGIYLEHNQYALIIYNNKRLSELWNLKTGFEIVNGGMYIHANDRLCNRYIRKFRERIKHDNSLDSIQKSDQEVLCSPAKLNLYVQVLNHRLIKLSWFKNQTLAEVEIAYKTVTKNELLTEKSEIDTEVCNRIKWRRDLKFVHELKSNYTHYIYIIENLEPHTRYATLVKTFDGDDDTQEARSEIKYITTKIDIPKAPIISLKSKTYNSLYIEFSPDKINTIDSPVVDFYVLQVFDMPDDKKILDTRDYCDEPVMDFLDKFREDYDDCCSLREIERADQIFLSELKQEFSCSLDSMEYCKGNYQEYNDKSERKPYITKRFEAWENNYTIKALDRFHLYLLQLQACNQAGCGSFSMLFTRTNYSLTADKIYDLTFCRTDNKNEYKVYFSEPKLPNGYVTSYAVHFRNNSFSGNEIASHQTSLVCVTRLEHERSNYVYVTNFKNGFNQAAVRVHSLGYHTLVEWVNITSCSDTKMHGNIWNYIIVTFLIGAVCIIMWICHKRRFWQRIPERIRRWIPLHSGWRFLRPEPYINEDRQNLVNGFELVHFRSIPEEEAIELQERNETE